MTDLEKSASAMGNDPRPSLVLKDGDLLGAIDDLIAHQEQTVRGLRAKLHAEEATLEHLRLARDARGRVLKRSEEAVAGAGKRRSTASYTILHLAKEAISEASRPLSRTEIVNYLEASESCPISRDLGSLVSKVLRKNDETFEPIGKGYRLRGQPAA
jgi:hypothetical protein